MLQKPLYIKEEMEKAGLQVYTDNFSARVRTRDFNYWNVSCKNVVGVKGGNALKDEIILVTAHYDSRIVYLLRSEEDFLIQVSESHISGQYGPILMFANQPTEPERMTMQEELPACWKLQESCKMSHLTEQYISLLLQGKNTIFLEARHGLKPIQN